MRGAVSCCRLREDAVLKPALVGRVTPCAPVGFAGMRTALRFRMKGGAHGVARPTFSQLPGFGQQAREQAEAYRTGKSASSRQRLP
jgi:hypothetical protein